MGVAMTGPGGLSSSVDQHIQQQQQQHQQQQQQQQQQMEQRDLNRTPVNALVDQFQNGINFHQDSGVGGVGGGYNAQRSLMNRSRSPGRELDSMPPQMHYENGLPPDASYGVANGYPPTYESDYGRMTSQSRLPRADPYAPNPYSGSYSMDATRQMDYG